MTLHTFAKQLKRHRLAAVSPALCLCLFAASAEADTSLATAGNGLSPILAIGDPATATLPMVLDPGADFDFDLGGSDKPKLQLQLSQPLSLQPGGEALLFNDGGNSLGLDATLAMPIGDNLSVNTGVERRLGASQFQSLGSIQCLNGTLRADSYTASGCHFVNEPIADYEQNRIGIGVRMNADSFTGSANVFRQQAEAGQPVMRRLNTPIAPVSGGANLVSPSLANPLLAGSAVDPLSFLNFETSGVDLNFKVGIATDDAGDIRLGLAFQRVLEAEFQGLYASGPDVLSWTAAEPFNSVQMNLEWSRGAFSGGIQGFYRDSVDFLNRNSIDSLTTFDVHFTWRTPWNANLTVGASNVLDAGAEVSTNADSSPVDPLESVYGRIPYVRYKQDL